MIQSKDRIKLVPDELVFTKIKPDHPSSKSFQIINISSESLEISVHTNNPERYNISPQFLEIDPDDSKSILVTVLLNSENIDDDKEIYDELYLKDDESEYKLGIRISVKSDEPLPSYSTKPSVGNREFTLAGGEDIEKELEHFRNRCQEVEQENSVLSTKIREFERNARLLTSERVTDRSKIELEKISREIAEKDSIIKQLEGALEDERAEKQDLLAELEQLKDSGDYFDKIKTLLKQTNPEIESIVEIALKEERYQNEKKNQKILEMFQNKDSRMGELESAIEEYEQENRKLSEILEEQTSFAQNAERTIKSLKESLSTQTDRVAELENELRRLNTTLSEQTNKLRFQEDELRGYKSQNEKLLQELSNLRKENSSKGGQSSSSYDQIAKERDQLLQQLNEYVAREEFIKELYARQQENKDDSSKQLHEKDQLIKTLEKKLALEQESVEELISELKKELDVKTEEIERLQEEGENKIRGLIEENEDLRRLLDEMQEQLTESQRNFEHTQAYGAHEMHTEELSHGGHHAKELADLKKQVNQLTESLQETKQTLTYEKREKADLIMNHNLKVSEMNHQLEELKSSRLPEGGARGFEQVNINKKEKERQMELERRCAELEKQLHEVEGENQRLAEETEILSQRIQIQGKGQEEFQNESLISRLNSRISALKYKEQKLYEENAKLEELYNELKNEYENARAIWEAERDQILQGEGRDLPYQSKATMLTDRLGASQLKASQDKLRESELSSSSTGDNVRRELQILKSIKSNLENEILLAVNKEKFLQNNIEMLTNERNEYKERANYHREQANLLEDQLREKDRGAKEEIFSMRRQILDLQSDLKVSEDAKQNLERELEERRALEDRLRMTDRLKDKAENDLANVKADYEGQIDELVDQMRTLQKLNQEFKSKITDQDIEYTNQINTLSEKESIINKLTNEKALLENKVRQLQSDNDELKKFNERISSQLGEMRKEFNSVKGDTDEEIRIRDIAEKELKNRIIGLEQRLDEANRERDRLKLELNSEVERLTRTHQETINLLRDDNKELEKKYFEELSERRREDEHFSEKERELLAENSSLKRELAQVMDQNSRMKLKKMSESGKKTLNKNKGSAKKSTRGFNSDTEEDPSYSTGGREADRIRLYEMDIQTKSLKISELKDQLAVVERDYSRSVREGEKLAKIIEEQRRELDLTRREMMNYESEKRSMEKSDTKLHSEVKEIRNYLNELRSERDRIAIEMRYTEEGKRAEQRRLDHLLQSLNHMEETQAVNEAKYQERIAELEREVEALNENQQRKTKDYDQAMALIALREKELQRKSMELEEMSERVVNDQDEKDSLNSRVQALEQAVVRETDKCIAIQNEFREEKERTEETLQILQEEMNEQNKRYEETMDIYERQIGMVKEKFVNDVKELQTKINIYFNQSDSIKKSLSSVQEKKNLEKIFEKYADNISQLSQKESTISSLKEKIKNLMTENKNIKENVKKLQENNEKLATDLETTQKKLKNSTIPKTKTSRTISSNITTTTRNPNLLESNKENFELNDQELSKKAPLKEVIALEAQLLTAKGENRKLVEEIKQLESLSLNFQHEVETLVKSEEMLQAEIKRLNKEQNEQQKNYKAEFNKMLAEVQNVKSQWHSPEAYEKLSQDLKEAENGLKLAKEDIQRKKEVINNLKSMKETKAGGQDDLKKENEQLKEEVDKLKKQIKEISRKDTSFKDFRAQYETLKQSEKALQEEKASNLEKIKALKAEVQRKESAIKDLRDKIDLLSINNDTRRFNEDEIDKNRDTIKKLKLEVERKDLALKNLKGKLDNTLFELDNIKTDSLTKTQANTGDYEKEVRKHEQTRVQLKNMEGQYQNAIFILRRLFRDTFSIIQKLRSKQPKVFAKTDARIPAGGEQYQRFSDSIDILNLSPEEIQMFVDPKNHHLLTTTESVGFGQHQQLEKFESELNNPSGINATLLYDMVSSIIDERINLEKKVK